MYICIYEVYIYTGNIYIVYIGNTIWGYGEI